MGRYIIVLFLICKSLLLFGGRELQFVDLTKQENKGFFRYGQEVPELVIKGIEQLEITPLRFTSNFRGFEMLTYDGYLQHKLYELDQEGGCFAFSQDFTHIAIDKIKGEKQFVHLFLNDTKTVTYRFSVYYDQLIDYVISQGDELSAYLL